NSGYAQEKPVEPAPAQSESKPTANTRLKIGVALEGGGALGIAHLDVLKWFEEHHIPVDYVAGTSMGGLVGGPSASGKSAGELKQIVDHANWPQLLGGDISYQDLAFRRKEDARDVPNNIKIGLKNGPRLPPGLSTGEHISLLIDRETLNYSTLPSFNDLPIPFRCVSTELISGKPYVFDHGSLSCAPRCPFRVYSIPCGKETRFSSMADWWTICLPTWCATWGRTW